MIDDIDKILRPDADNIDEDLKREGLFCVWKGVGKEPYDPRTGKHACVNDPNTFTTFQEAKTAYNSDGEWDGIGMLNQGGYGFIDVDGCVENGEVNEHARSIIALVHGYTEFSPSGTGVRIVFWIDVKNQTCAGGKPWPEGKEVYDKYHYQKNPSNHTEAYFPVYTNRYATITGHVVPGCEGWRARDVNFNNLETFLNIYMKKPESENTDSGHARDIKNNPLPVDEYSDTELLDIIRNSTQGDKFSRLFDTPIKWSTTGESEGDQSLANILCWWTCHDRDRIEKLMFQSKRVREKWIKRQDYIDRTISNALKFIPDSDGFLIEKESNQSDWHETLKTNEDGKLLDLIANYQTILENDKNLKDSIGGINGLDNIAHKKGSLPWYEPIPGDRMEWTDTDDSGLRAYIQSNYPGLRCGRNLTDAVNLTHQKNYYHPIRDYLNSVAWDGIPRAENLFIDFLGCENSDYTKTITKKILTAGVARAFDPGCKFDNMVVLVGSQGIGKSYLLSRLGKDWFSDNIRTTNDNASVEALQGNWILEFSELSAFKKSEIEATKAFISRQTDKTRLAYEKHVRSFPRQCIFFGTTNESEFLNDTTGNRRYWILRTHEDRISKGMFEDSENYELTDEYIDQIWAEAVLWYRNGERLTLPEEIRLDAMLEQEAHTYQHPEIEQIKQYLSLKIPNNFYSFKKLDRQRLCQQWMTETKGVFDCNIPSPEYYKSEDLYPREFVSAYEILYELFEVETTQAQENKNLMKNIRNTLRSEGWDEIKNPMRIPEYGKIRVFRNPYYKNTPCKTINESERWLY